MVNAFGWAQSCERAYIACDMKLLTPGSAGTIDSVMPDVRPLRSIVWRGG
jgi:hypothetical protein